MPPEGSSYLFFKTDSTDLTYTWDSPGDARGVAIICLSRDCEPLPLSGLVPLGETQAPKYALETTLGTNTVVNYGCYANRQR